MEHENGDLDRLQEWEDLRRRVQGTIPSACNTLAWFANCFVETDSLPASTSPLRDRPLVRSAANLGPAFDVWHALLSAERVLRPLDQAVPLMKPITALRQRLIELTTQQPQADPYARSLVSDDSYGTFNMLTAAAVLRSEIYPERSKSSPSYLAGYILFAELALAAAHAESHATTGLGARPPRLALVSEGAHTFILYVEHLRARAHAFDLLADELSEVAVLENRIKRLTDGEPSPTLVAAIDGRLRLSLARQSALCDRCESLVVAVAELERLHVGQGEREDRPHPSIRDAVATSSCAPWSTAPRPWAMSRMAAWSPSHGSSI